MNQYAWRLQQIHHQLHDQLLSTLQQWTDPQALTVLETQFGLTDNKFSARAALKRIPYALQHAVDLLQSSLFADLNRCSTGHYADVVKWIDYAWRRLPTHTTYWAKLYAIALYLDGQALIPAARLLSTQGASQGPEESTLLALIDLQLNQLESAQAHLHHALQQQACDFDSLLGLTCSLLVASKGEQLPGWIGWNQHLHLICALSPPYTTDQLEVINDDGEAIIGEWSSLGTQNPNKLTFSFKNNADNKLKVHIKIKRADLLPLIGNGLTHPAHFGLDGRLHVIDRHLTGWVNIPWLNSSCDDLPPQVKIFSDSHHLHKIKLNWQRFTAAAILHFDHDELMPFNSWVFTSVDPIITPHFEATAKSLTLKVQLPDQDFHALPDSPYLFRQAALTDDLHLLDASIECMHAPTSSNSHQARSDFKAVTIVIPIYQQRELAITCLDSVLATVDQRAHILVIDDASSDELLADALMHRARDSRVRLIQHKKNLGFVKTINEALKQIEGDVVLLNSDTEVYGDWLARLQAAAYACANVSSVTPWSNAGSVATYPAASEVITRESAAHLNSLVERIHPNVSADIPVGVGFCMYLRHDCLRDVGEFNAEVFDQGYGEESDFCMRARRRGWTHRLAADVYVYHAEGQSFGSRRMALLHRSERLLNLRHSGYTDFVLRYQRTDPLSKLRRELDLERLIDLIQTQSSSSALIVTLALPGGVDRVVAERCLQLRQRGRTPIIIRPHRVGHFKKFELWSDQLSSPDLNFSLDELPEFASLLPRFNIEHIEIHHFLHVSAQVIDTLMDAGAPVDIYLHDYAWLCPRVTMMGKDHRYCGAPALPQCEKCAATLGNQLQERISVAQLRERSARWLSQARDCYAPSIDTAQRYQSIFPSLRCTIKPLSQPRINPNAQAKGLDPLSSKEKTRVAVIGAIGTHKGFRVLQQCARDALRRQLPLEFVVIGYTENDATLERIGNIRITGRYAESELPYLLQREAPDIIFMPSVWPETWCFALDHALTSGKPIVAFEIGALVERLRDVPNSCLIPLTGQAQWINDTILTLRNAHETPSSSAGTPTQGQPRLDRIQDSPSPASVTTLVTAGLELKVHIMDNINTATTVDDGLSASVKILPLPTGLYLFSVTNASTSPLPTSTSPALAPLTLPAVHFGLGPGVHSSLIEFMGGVSTRDAWLATPGDLLVARVNGAGASLIITSIRTASGDTLSIKIERLDGRAASSVEATPRSQPLPAVATPIAAKDIVAPPPPRSPADGLSLLIGTHIRARGDVNFTDAAWAGRVGPGKWIESFCVKPLQDLGMMDIEYKGLTASGFETPWLSNNAMCGTRGMSIPLIGFAIRLKPGTLSSDYDCIYSGYFQSGLTNGPVRNGSPCRSTVANDPLEGLQIRIIPRQPRPTENPPQREASVALRAEPAVKATASTKTTKSKASSKASSSKPNKPPRTSRKR